MAEKLTLESLARRVERLEVQIRRLRGIAPAKDWRRFVGMFDGSEFMKKVDEEVRKMREADRRRASRRKPDVS